MKIKSALISLVIASMATVPALCVNAESQISLQIEGKTIETQVPPAIIDGRTMVPVRDIFEACGAEVEWDSDTKTITGKKGSTTVVMQIDSKTVFINQEVVEMDAAPVIVEGRTLAPARYVAESFGGIVDWDAENKVVMIQGVDNEEDTTVLTTETTTQTTTQTTTVATTEVTTETTTEAIKETTTVAIPSDAIVSRVNTDLQNAMGTYSLGSYDTAGKFKTTAVKQITDNWTSMAKTTVDKKYVGVSKTFYNRVSYCYKVIDELYRNKEYGKHLSNLREIMTNYKNDANELINGYYKTRDLTELTNISNQVYKFVSDMRQEVKILSDNT